MNIRDDFTPYRDGNGLMAPSPVPSGTIRGSDNGTMFTSEYHIILNRNGQLTNTDGIEYAGLIKKCIGTDNCLHRAPGDTSTDVIDDYLGVLAGYAEFNDKANFNVPYQLWRFPQLMYAWYLAVGAPALLMLPFGIITALIIALSCIGAPASDSNSRRLNWLLWQATKRKSWLCNLAGKFWHWRQKKVYNTDMVMKAVAAIYYQPQGLDNNPYSKYWVD